MKKHALFFLFILVLSAIGFSYIYVTSYKPDIGKGKPVMQADIESLLLGPVSLYDIKMDADLVMQPPWVPTDIPSLLSHKPRHISIANADAVYEDGKMSVQGIRLNFTQPEKPGMLQGTWEVNSIVADKLPYLLPELAGKGSFVMTAESAILKGTLHNAVDTHEIRFIATLNIKDMADSSINVTDGHMPFEGGTIRINDGQMTFKGKVRFKGTLSAENILLGALLGDLMDGKVSASGSVSGVLPVTLLEDGTPVIHDAQLSTAEGGSIVVSPGALPRSNDQLAMVNDLLTNFWYKTLTITLNSTNVKGLTSTMTVEGYNPDFYEGRTVKLNVHLGGDLLSLIQSSVLSLTDPKSLLKKDTHESP